MAEKTIKLYTCDACGQALTQAKSGVALSNLAWVGGMNSNRQQLASGETCYCVGCLCKLLGVPREIVREVTRSQYPNDYGGDYYMPPQDRKNNGGASGRPLLCDDSPVLAPLRRSTDWSR
jgi:hypothetical protein